MQKVDARSITSSPIAPRTKESERNKPRLTARKDIARGVTDVATALTAFERAATAMPRRTVLLSDDFAVGRDVKLESCAPDSIACKETEKRDATKSDAADHQSAITGRVSRTS